MKKKDGYRFYIKGKLDGMIEAIDKITEDIENPENGWEERLGESAFKELTTAFDALRKEANSP